MQVKLCQFGFFSMYCSQILSIIISLMIKYLPIYLLKNYNGINIYVF